MKNCFLCIFFILSFIFCPLSLDAEISIDTPSWQKVEALEKKNNYTFLFFGDGNTEENKKMGVILEEIKQELSNGKNRNSASRGRSFEIVGIVKVALNDPKEEKLIKFFGIKENPTVLVIAPNGAITGYFPKTVDKKTLTESLVSLKETEIIKNIQERCVAFLCFYKKTEPNFTTIKSDLKSVADNFRGSVNVIYVDSDDKKEEKLRKKFEMSSKTTTVFIVVPPGRAVAKLEGDEITKANLMKTLMSACGSGGCGSSCK